MEVKKLRDLIQEIHDSGDCGYMLSDVLEMANKICEQPSDLEIVQKALEETGFELEYFPSGNWWIHSTGTIGQVVRTGTGSQSLLTWAKQTIEGVE